MKRRNAKVNWREDLQKIRNSRAKADAAAKKAEEKARRMAAQQ